MLKPFKIVLCDGSIFGSLEHWDTLYMFVTTPSFCAPRSRNSSPNRQFLWNPLWSAATTVAFFKGNFTCAPYEFLQVKMMCFLIYRWGERHTVVYCLKHQGLVTQRESWLPLRSTHLSKISVWLQGSDYTAMSKMNTNNLAGIWQGFSRLCLG